MSNIILLLLVTVLYAGQIFVSVWHGQLNHALIVTGYVIANIGLILSMK